jgi:hypothetical protein
MAALSKEEGMARIIDIQQQYAVEIRRVYAEAEEHIVAGIAKRVAKGIDVVNNPGWREQKLAEIRALRREVQGEIAHLKGLDPKNPAGYRGCLGSRSRRG